MGVGLAAAGWEPDISEGYNVEERNRIEAYAQCALRRVENCSKQQVNGQIGRPEKSVC